MGIAHAEMPVPMAASPEEVGLSSVQLKRLEAVTKKQLLMRVLHNLLGIARREQDQAGTLRYLDALLTVQPDAAEERGMRAATRFTTGDLKGAREDVEWLYEKRPEGLDLNRVEQMRRYLDKMLSEKKD